MNKIVKVVLLMVSALIIFYIVLAGIGMYAMQIEDTYGSNQDIFFEASDGDIVVNHDTKEIGEVRKSWTTLHIIHNHDTINIAEWWDDKHIDVYRVEDRTVLPAIRYSDLKQLVAGNKLVLSGKLRE